VHNHSPPVRLPGAVLQGILARGALAFLRIYLGLVFLYSAWLGISTELPATPLSWAELVLGAVLVLGLATRLAAAVAAVILVSSMVAAGVTPSPTSSSQAAFVAIALALLIGAAGRTFGVDSVLARRWPRSPLW
jgi:uncharacterized membrane protein YphA (DoxX/SURF4 family)